MIISNTVDLIGSYPISIDPIIMYTSGILKIPARISKVRVDCVGASGVAYQGKTAGKGGRVQCILSVLPATEYWVTVGIARANYSSIVNNSSDIRTNADDLYSRLVVAGGGGSTGTAWSGRDSTSNGGDGGGLIGATAPNTGYWHGNARGGAGGGDGISGFNDSFGYGQTAGRNNQGLGYSGSGGDGWYGGARGGTGTAKHKKHLYAHAAGGGGGSSYTDPTLCSEVVHTQGYQMGNGYVAIYFDV